MPSPLQKCIILNKNSTSRHFVQCWVVVLLNFPACYHHLGSFKKKKKWCYTSQMTFEFSPQRGWGNWGREMWHDLPVVTTQISRRELLKQKPAQTNVPTQATFWNSVTDTSSEGITLAKSNPVWALRKQRLPLLIIKSTGSLWDPREGGTIPKHEPSPLCLLRSVFRNFSEFNFTYWF